MMRRRRRRMMTRMLYGMDVYAAVSLINVDSP
jgi:hypothetical protein